MNLKIMRSKFNFY